MVNGTWRGGLTVRTAVRALGRPKEPSRRIQSISGWSVQPAAARSVSANSTFGGSIPASARAASWAVCQAGKRRRGWIPSVRSASVVELDLPVRGLGVILPEPDEERLGAEFDGLEPLRLVLDPVAGDRDIHLASRQRGAEIGQPVSRRPLPRPSPTSRSTVAGWMRWSSVSVDTRCSWSWLRSDSAAPVSEAQLRARSLGVHLLLGRGGHCGHGLARPTEAGSVACVVVDGAGGDHAVAPFHRPSHRGGHPPAGVLGPRIRPGTSGLLFVEALGPISAESDSANPALNPPPRSSAESPARPTKPKVARR